MLCLFVWQAPFRAVGLTGRLVPCFLLDVEIEQGATCLVHGKLDNRWSYCYSVNGGFSLGYRLLSRFTQKSPSIGWPTLQPTNKREEVIQ
jgi:hypothetical protein